MKRLKKYVSILLMLSLLTGLASCEDDETIFDEVVGRTWVGFLGFDNGFEDLESGVYLGSDGFGEDKLYFYSDGAYYDTFRIKWTISGGSIFIDYGRKIAPRELKNVYVRKGYLSAELYIDGYYIEDVELVME